MRKKICPITNQIMDCKTCKSIKDGETCILWEPEEWTFKWAMRLAAKIRKGMK